jgi:branched-chain amino acid transport system substrate-binding protein
VVGLVVAACGSSGNSTSSSSSSGQALDSGKPFVIGVVVPLSGPFAAVGQEIVQGMQLAVDNLDDGNGILGRKVQLVTRDDGGTTAKAILAAKDLMQNQKVDVLFPDAISAETLAVLPLTTQAKKVTITSASDPREANISNFPYSFQLSIPSDVQSRPTVYGAKLAGGHKVALLVTNDATGTSIGDQMQKLLQKGIFGLSLVDYQKFDPTATDITPVLQKLKGEGTDTIITQAAGTAVGVVMRGVRDLSWDVKVVGTNGTMTGDVTKLIPQPVQAQFSAVVVGGLVRTSPDKVDEPYTEFATELAKSGPITNLQVPSLHRDIVMLTAWAYNKVGSEDQEKVRAALESLGSTKLPDGYLLVFAQPGFTKDMHSTEKADYSNFWGVAKVSPRLNGTYLGQRFALPTSDQ